MDLKCIRIQVIQRLDQALARFRAEYHDLSERERSDLRHRLAKAGQRWSDEGNVAQILVYAHEDGRIRSVHLNPVVFLEAVDAWNNGKLFSPAPGALFEQSSLR
jgi:hypothetical protein